MQMQGDIENVTINQRHLCISQAQIKNYLADLLKVED